MSQKKGLTREQMLERVRQRVKDKKGGGGFQKDPTEWKPAKIGKGEPDQSLKMIVLSGLEPGDAIADDGVATTDMSDLYYMSAGRHWVDRRPYECPRIFNSEECPLCKLGFDLMKETDDKAVRREIAKKYLPGEYQVVNVYFPPYKSNPEELRGQVRWWAISQRSIWELFEECINRDESEAEGDTPEEAKAYGFFYMPEESYVFNVVVANKGDWNDYNKSKFLPSTRGPLVGKNGQAEWDTITEVLSKRQDLAKKYGEPDLAKLQAIADKMMNPDGDDFDESESASETETPKDEIKPTPSQAVNESEDELLDESAPTESAAAPVTAGESPKEELDSELEDLLEQIKKDK